MAKAHLNIAYVAADAIACVSHDKVERST
jgi:hypothetical protein